MVIAQVNGPTLKVLLIMAPAPASGGHLELRYFPRQIGEPGEDGAALVTRPLTGTGPGRAFAPGAHGAEVLRRDPDELCALLAGDEGFESAAFDLRKRGFDALHQAFKFGRQVDLRQSEVFIERHSEPFRSDPRETRYRARRLNQKI